jgi:hypothetical protein
MFASVPVKQAVERCSRRCEWLPGNSLHSSRRIEESRFVLEVGMHVLDAYFATLRENKLMEWMNLSDHDISDDTLKAIGFTAF